MYLRVIFVIVHEVYWEMVRLRKNMVLARLGLSLNA